MQGRIFFSGPLFSEAERSYNASIAARLLKEGFEVWLPQEKGIVKKGTAPEKQYLFKEDLEGIRGSAVILAILDGTDVDAGTAFELGYAHAIGKPLFGLKTDYRFFSPVENVNLMIEVAVRQIFRSLEEVIAALKSEVL
jgi:nucleoside 2-deoxyribosyltransferase